MIVLAACTQAKRGSIPERLHLRAHQGDPRTVHRSWERALAAAGDRVPARQVYKGGYWRGVQALREHLGASVRVVSAGLGLISDETQISAYSATFVAGDPDSVPAAGTVNGRWTWWNLLNGSADLRKLSLNEPLVVVLPATYLRLVESDLDALAAQHGTEQLVVFGPAEGPTGKDGALARVWVTTDARMAWKLGANVSALAPVVARHCLRDVRSTLDHDALRAIAATLLVGAIGPVYPKRARQTHAEVRAWIRDQLTQADPPSSATVALRRFREAGLAFEQRAFHYDFHQVSTDKEPSGD